MMTTEFHDEHVPRYWLDLFTEETWLEAARHGFTVSGFTEGRWATVRRIRPGDVLICYLTKRSSYVGLLRVTGEPFQDSTPVWASQVFPGRVPVRLELGLRPDGGVPVQSLSDGLSYFQNLTSPNAWSGHFRGNPAAIKTEDAAVIIAALQEAAADADRVLDLAHIPQPAIRQQRSRQLAAPPEVLPVVPLPPVVEVQPEVIAAIDPSRVVYVLEAEDEMLTSRLVQASTASEDAAAFEDAIKDVFSFLGFRTERRSGPGDTDVLVVAPLGEETYAAVVDGKTSRQGRVGNAQIDWYALERHKAQHGVDHILVVAANFSGGELARDAERTGAALLTARDLAEVIRLHVATPFALPTLRDLFRYPGKPDLPLARMREHAHETLRLQQLLPDIVDAIEEAYRYELYDPVNADTLLLPLASRLASRRRDRSGRLLQAPTRDVLRRHPLRTPTPNRGR